MNKIARAGLANWVRDMTWDVSVDSAEPAAASMKQIIRDTGRYTLDTSDPYLPQAPLDVSRLAQSSRWAHFSKKFAR